jgi:2-polyprenyl-3-methyl-5-hydroxy-6-metoxy-1,4-benzoquinol methylase
VAVYGDLARQDVIELVPAGAKRVLDVGCWRGAFGAQLVDRGLEVWGVEPQLEAATSAARRLSHVITGKFPDDMPEGERFDCITFLDVLEHAFEPRAMLETAHEYLTRQGTVVASIPNVRHVTVVADLVRRGRWDYQESGLLDWTHIRFFTKATMKELLQNAGYTVERCEPLSMTPLTGRLKLLKLLGSRREQFLTLQYGLVGRSLRAP